VEVNRVVGGREWWLLSRWSSRRGGKLTDEDSAPPHGGFRSSASYRNGKWLWAGCWAAHWALAVGLRSSGLFSFFLFCFFFSISLFSLLFFLFESKLFFIILKMGPFLK
jgi:hypothetical protein